MYTRAVQGGAYLFSLHHSYLMKCTYVSLFFVNLIRQWIFCNLALSNNSGFAEIKPKLQYSKFNDNLTGIGSSLRY